MLVCFFAEVGIETVKIVFRPEQFQSECFPGSGVASGNCFSNMKQFGTVKFGFQCMLCFIGEHPEKLFAYGGPNRKT